MHAIRINDHQTVVLLVKQETMTQITPKGIRPVLMTQVGLFDGEADLRPMGTGIAIMAPEENENDQLKAIKLALRRALNRAPSIDDDDRGPLYQTLLNAARQQSLQQPPPAQFQSFDAETPYPVREMGFDPGMHSLYHHLGH